MKKVPINKELLTYFKSKPQTLIMEGYCQHGSDTVVYSDGKSFALTTYACGGNHCCFYTQDVQFVDQVVALLHGKVEFSGVNEVVTKHLATKYKFLWKTDCGLHVHNGLPLPHKCVGDLRKMSPDYAQQISDGTFYGAAVEDIRHCLQLHPSSALYVDGKPVCWSLLHVEKSLGMLYTLPEHRHKGYALEVMTHLSNQVLAQGDVPYAYIVQTNVASINLAKKYNLKYVEDAYYFEIDLG